ncbi:MAG: hypothetical protein HZB26_02535 [Candidatus Hydrogenedentes bacterium]|nr:hypothetical protein [Candidatus Hydrogenedentota bacterium]
MFGSIPASNQTAISTKSLFTTFLVTQHAIPVWTLEGRAGFFFLAGMAIDADGAPNAYDPENQRGLDFLGNAGCNGNWWALATDNGRASGKPLIQTGGEFKGFYIAQTSLRDNSKPDADITKYADSRHVPFISLPKGLMERGVGQVGDLAVVYNMRNDKLEFAIVADEGPNDAIGEGSISLARSLGIGINMRAHSAGQDTDVVYLVFPGTATRPKWPRSQEEIRDKAASAFADWGGLSQLKRVIAE